MTNPTLTEKDVAEIANALPADQKLAILHGRCGVPRMNGEWSADCICAAEAARDVEIAGLAYLRQTFPGGIVLNAKGLAVRNHLISTPNMPKGDRA